MLIYLNKHMQQRIQEIEHLQMSQKNSTIQRIMLQCLHVHVQTTCK